MKKNIIKLFISAALIIVAFTSCNKSLDLSPVSSISDANYWKTADQFAAFVTGVHSRFRSHETNFMYLGELRGDIFGTDEGSTGAFTGEATQGVERMWQQTLDLDNYVVGNYGGFYTNINQLNLLIDKLSGTDVLAADTKNYYLGIAYGMRAFYYFQIYRSWGKAVIQTAYEEIDIANLAKEAAPAEEVLALVKDDIDASLTSFGTNYTMEQERGFWSKAATEMLKAEVYLWTAHRGGGVEDADIAKQALLAIQNNVSLTLQDDFGQVFETSNSGNEEIIFAAKHLLNESTLAFIGNFVPQTSLIINYYDSLENRKFATTTDNYDGLLRAPTKIVAYRKFSDLDSRKNSSIQAAYNMSNGRYTIAGCFLKKYQGEQNAGSRAYTNDYPIYRYADLLLLLAEAKVILGEDPSNEINQVRKRAYGTHYNAAIHAYPNQEIDGNPEEAILQERFFEFIGEGKRWYDLRRFGDNYVYAHTILTAAESYKLLWPIDRSTLTNNRSLSQTEGYQSY